MALKRSFLLGMGLTEEQVSAIVEAHAETVDSLKEQRDSYKESADKLKGVQAELDALKAKSPEGDEWQEKYEAEHAAFEKFKADQETAKVAAKKDSAYRALLKECGVSENRIDAIMKITSLDDLKLDKDGNITKSDELKESVKAEWKDFIVTQNTQGTQTQTPPATAGGKKLTKEEIYKTDERGRYVLSTQERQEALIQLNKSSN